MKVVVIGGTGHIGTFLIPRLVVSGHEVVVVSRGAHQPYQNHPTWKEVRMLALDRESAEQAGSFASSIREMRPDVVIDLICFRLESARMLVEALRDQVQLLVHCGTVWVHGYSTQVPATEELPRHPLGEYGRQKNEIEGYLLDQAHRIGFPVTAIHPGHIVGPGWEPVAPIACHDLQAFAKLARGEELALPNFGMETVHHVHADDVAQAFIKAMEHWSASVGEGFYIVSKSALTLRGFAEVAAVWFGQKARLRYLPLEEWKKTLLPEFVESAIAHLEHSTNFSCAKAERLLDYQPRYTSLEAVYESVMWMIDHGRLQIS